MRVYRIHCSTSVDIAENQMARAESEYVERRVCMFLSGKWEGKPKARQ